MINNSHRNLEKSKSETPMRMISKAFIFDTAEYTGKYSGGCMYIYLDSKNVKYFLKGFWFWFFFKGGTVICLTLPRVYHSLD